MHRIYPQIELTNEMVIAAKELIQHVRVDRTVASTIDTLTGILGEIAFAQYLFGDWRKHRVGSNKGDVDFTDIEVKTSAFPFRESLNLLVREDYAAKRKPKFYVQVIINVTSDKADDIKPGTEALICGFAGSQEVDRAPKRDFGSKIACKGGYACHHIPITSLHPMEEFQAAYHRRRIDTKTP